MESTTGLESPQSISITLYYKGFSMIVTKRDPKVSVVSLIQEAMKGIDWAIEQGLKPSWNKQTNEEVQPSQKKTIHANEEEAHSSTEWLEQPTNLGNCRNCGASNKLSKAGKAYCSKLCWKK